MDAQELPEVKLTSAGADKTFVKEFSAPVPDSDRCLGHCVPAQCSAACALYVIDDLLSRPEGVTPQEADYLLDLRHLLRSRDDAETALRTFCALRCTLEPRQYLAFYRLRRWFENQVSVTIRSGISKDTVQIPLKLDRYCLEAVRRRCLCQCLSEGFVLGGASLRFAFYPRRG